MYRSHDVHSITTFAAFAVEPGEMAQQRAHTALARTGVHFSAPTLQTPVIPGPRSFYVSDL